MPKIKYKTKYDEEVIGQNRVIKLTISCDKKNFFIYDLFSKNNKKHKNSLEKILKKNNTNLLDKFFANYKEKLKMISES